MAAIQRHVKKDAIQIICPATPLQEGLDAISTRPGFTHVSVRISDISNFTSAWEKAYRMFPILRTCIITNPKSEALRVVVDGPTKGESERGFSIEYRNRSPVLQLPPSPASLSKSFVTASAKPVYSLSSRSFTDARLIAPPPVLPTPNAISKASTSIRRIRSGTQHSRVVARPQAFLACHRLQVILVQIPSFATPFTCRVSQAVAFSRPLCLELLGLLSLRGI